MNCLMFAPVCSMEHYIRRICTSRICALKNIGQDKVTSLPRGFAQLAIFFPCSRIDEQHDSLRVDAIAQASSVLFCCKPYIYIHMCFPTKCASFSNLGAHHIYIYININIYIYISLYIQIDEIGYGYTIAFFILKPQS